MPVVNDKNHEKKITQSYFRVIYCLLDHARVFVTFTGMTHARVSLSETNLCQVFRSYFQGSLNSSATCKLSSVSVKDREKCIIVTEHPSFGCEQTDFFYIRILPAINSVRDTATIIIKIWK